MIKYSEKFMQIMAFYFVLAFVVPFVAPYIIKTITKEAQVGDIYAILSVVAAGLWFTAGKKMTK